MKYWDSSKRYHSCVGNFIFLFGEQHEKCSLLHIFGVNLFVCYSMGFIPSLKSGVRIKSLLSCNWLRSSQDHKYKFWHLGWSRALIITMYDLFLMYSLSCKIFWDMKMKHAFQNKYLSQWYSYWQSKRFCLISQLHTQIQYYSTVVNGFSDKRLWPNAHGSV